MVGHMSGFLFFNYERMIIIWHTDGMREKFFIGLFALLIIVAGILYVIPEKPLEPSLPFPQPQLPVVEPIPISLPPHQESEIEVQTPKENDSVTSPLHVSGKARGTWYFEASFPVTILDANKKILAKVPVQAKGEWMTEDFVEFEGDITFLAPTTDTGVVIFENDNPSGDPARAKSIEIPVRFK